LNAAEAHDGVRRIFLDRILTTETLQAAVDALVKKDSQSDLLAAQRTPLAASFAQIERETGNYVAALGLGGARPESVLNALAEREAAKKKLGAELQDLDRRERAVRDFDAGAAEKKLREELTTWRAVLEHDPTRGRVVLRQLLQGPIEAEYSEESGQWYFAGVASVEGATRTIVGVPVSAATADFIAREGLTLERLGELIHAELRRVREQREAGAAHSGSPAAKPTSRVQRLSCPRGDSNTRHAV
jgi:hypothetical protein